MKRTILVASQQLPLRASIARLLQSLDFSVEVASSEKRARLIVATEKLFAAIITADSLDTWRGGLALEVTRSVQRTIVLADTQTEVQRAGRAFPEAHILKSNPLDQAQLSDLLSKTPVVDLHQLPRIVFHFEGCALDLGGRSLTDVTGREVTLTHAEFELLTTLVSQGGRVLSRNQLRETLGGRRADAYDRSVDMLVARLRRKIESDPRKPRLIATVPGIGYKFAVPIRRSELKPSVEPGHTSVPAHRPVDSRPSLAVLPVLDLSDATHSRGKFADALTDELISAFGRLPGLLVTARQSVMGYRGVTKDVRSIAADLGVRYVIEGTVDLDRQLRTNIRLVDGVSGFQLWGDSRTLPLGEVTGMRDRLVSEVSSRLQPQLNLLEMRRALAQPIDGLDAWAFLQRANGLFMFRGRTEALREAIDPLERALEKDPDFAMAHALLAAIYALRAVSMAFPNRAEEREAALQHANIALQIEPGNSFVLSNCAEALLYSGGDLNRVNGILEKAVKRGSNEPHSLVLLGHVRRLMGENARDSLALIEQARRISPQDPRTSRWHYYANWCHFKLRDFKSMEMECLNSIGRDSKHGWSWLALVSSLGFQGRQQEARQASKVLHSVLPGFNPDDYYETVKHMYGQHFTAAVEAEYSELLDVLRRSTSRSGGSADRLM